MKIRSLGYYLAEAGKSIFRNKLMSFSSCLTVAACLFIVILFYCIAANIDSTLGEIQTGIEITVFIEDDSEERKIDVNELYRKIVALDHVVSADYSSKEDNMRSFISKSGREELFEGFLDSNPLRRSFKIIIDDSTYTSRVVEILKSEEMIEAGIATVNNIAEIVEMVSSLSNSIRIVCLVIIFSLGTLSVVIITNTIKLTINSRRTEIGIMKYIGATNRFIRWPFVLEGLMLGIIGSVVPIIICVLTYDNVIEFVIINYSFISTIIHFRPGMEIFPYVIPMIVFLGSVIGTLGSLFTIRKYLDV